MRSQVGLIHESVLSRKTRENFNRCLIVLIPPVTHMKCFTLAYYSPAPFVRTRTV